MPTYYQTNCLTWEILHKAKKKKLEEKNSGKGVNKRIPFPFDVQKELENVGICDYCKFTFCELCIGAKHDMHKIYATKKSEEKRFVERYLKPKMKPKI